jgi:hypothetical protein
LYSVSYQAVTVEFDGQRGELFKSGHTRPDSFLRGDREQPRIGYNVKMKEMFQDGKIIRAISRLVNNKPPVLIERHKPVSI